MIDSSALLADLKAQLRVLQADLKERADDPTTEWGADLRREHAEALRRERTGLSWTAWRDNEVDQAAVAWIVATTFVRFCEDNDLLVGATLDGLPVPVGWIAGPGDRTLRARENQTAYFRTNTSHHDRDWLQQSFRVLAAQPAGAALVDPQHNPVWTAEISAEAAKGLVDFWRRTDAGGALMHDFTDPDLDTRFLGDLYQDLSEHAKKTYALLQTPVFVEEFILDRTLTPAIQEFGLDGLKLIDPTCGSGHFLLGAFERLNRQWAAEAPGLDPKQRVRKAMDSIHGVDLNPFAVAISRFRLTVAGLQAAGEKSLVGASEYGYHLAIGDSLLGEQGVAGVLFGENSFTYAAEDISEYAGILKPGQYHVVVGNPPYIAVRDRALKMAYKSAYAVCSGQWTLIVPFMELFFRLAKRGAQGTPAGFVGKITGNSFMAREFGRKLIEGFIGGRDASLAYENPVDLSLVVNTAGAYIPGHGTPTVILVGRRRRPQTRSVRAVLSVRGEPGRPQDPSDGLVWQQISRHVDEPGFDGEFVSVVDLDREVLGKYPWSLSGGGAQNLKALLDESIGRLGHRISRMGMFGDSHAEDCFAAPIGAFRRLGVAESDIVMAIDGHSIRDFSVACTSEMFFAGGPANRTSATSSSRRALWPWKASLGARATFSGGSYRDAGVDWLAWHQVSARVEEQPRISFVKIATHFSAALVSGKEVEKPGALRIELPPDSPDREYFDLLGLLATSTACFWIKQVSHDKGNRGYGGGITDQEWERFFEFTGTKLQEFPLPAELPRARGVVLDELAHELGSVTPRAVVAGWRDSRVEGGLADALVRAHEQWSRLRERLVFEQEELDWETYALYGLVDEPMTYDGSCVEVIRLGQRAFEIALTRRIEGGEEVSDWFVRHGSIPMREVPAEWPEDYRALVEKRLALMESDRSIRLLERPEYKRRWAISPWGKQLREALEAVILDRLEDAELWRDYQGPSTRSVAQLADLLRNDEVLLELARELTGNPEPDLVAVIGSLAPTEAVPYLAAYRYKPSGLEKFREWKTVWGLQRREDAGEKVTIPVPPKYSTPDFQKVEYWRARGKLDVPKERFVLYPGVGREADLSPVLGWAGWNHRDQAVALVREIMNQQALGVPQEALVPMVAGLVELEPWLHQWHTELEPEFGSSAAQAVTSQIDQFLAQLQMTRDDVNAWLPPAATRGRRRRA